MELTEHEICAVCDKPGAKQCAKCHGINYCSAECQVQDWRNVHAYECAAYASDEWRYTEAGVTAGVTADAEAAADCPPLLALPRGVTINGPFDPPPVASYRSHVHAVTWDLDETNTYTEAEWRSTENAVGQAWRTYLSGLAQTDALPEILLVSLQAVQQRNGLYAATLAMLEEVSGADWRGLRVYDSSILSRLGGLYQSQQLVFWRPAATVVNIWKTGTTCFRVGMRPNLNCEYGAAGVYLTYHPNDKALAAVPPIPLVAVSVHMDPATRKGRISSYQQVLRRLVPKLIRARKLQDHIRPPLDCVTVLMAGDMGWRRSSASAGAGTSADPLTLARFPAAGAGAGAADARIFPFPEWAEVGQPYGGQMPITRDFVPPYRATCPMHTAKTFRPQFHQTVLQARQAGTADAYTGEYPATHCDRVFIKFPKNVYSLSAREWAANLLVPQSVNGHHEALAVHLPIEFDFRGACTNSPIAALIAETAANVQALAEYTPEEWHDELAIARALDVHHAERAGAEDALVGAAAPLLHRVTSAEMHGATEEAVAAAAGATVAVASEVQEESTCLTDDALQAALSAAELRKHLRAIAALYVRAAGTNDLREILHEDRLVTSLAAPVAVALHEARTSVTRLSRHLDQAITPTHEGEVELDEW